MIEGLIKVAGHAAKMDDVDQKLIGALRRDGRASLSELSALLGLSRATVRARMDRLTAAGEIQGFTVVTRGDVTAMPVRGLMMVGIEGRGTDRIRARLAGMPEIIAVHSTNGRWDLIAEIGTRTLEEFDEVLGRIRKFEGVTSSETSLMLATQRAGRR